MADAKVIKSFNEYYSLIQRDNPDNKEAAMKTAAIMSQTELITKELDEINSQIVIPLEHNYEYKLDNIITVLRDIAISLNDNIDIVNELRAICKKLNN
jgi:hypothetical protein